MTVKGSRIWKSLDDPAYRQEWSKENVNVGLAFQIRALREKRGWTQSQLAEASETKQAVLSSWENPNYGKYTISTLKRLAAAFDVGLLVRFVPFSELVDWTANVTPERITPASYDEESESIAAAAIQTPNVEQNRTTGNLPTVSAVSLRVGGVTKPRHTRKDNPAPVDNALMWESKARRNKFSHRRMKEMKYSKGSKQSSHRIARAS